MEEQELAKAIDGLGGTLYIVGGWVRDTLRHAEPKDKDYVVVGVKEDVLVETFPQLQKIGKSFPVFLMEIDGVMAELALARKEVKQGTGYKGFAVEANPEISLTEDLYRRDTRMNGIALRVLDKKIFDPFHGQEDIKNKVIDAISEHFKEDPVRSLRAARQACELDFAVSDATIEYMRATGEELAKEPGERLFNEFKRALATKKPSRFFRILQQADLLRFTFPELHALIGQTQPKDFHPEGDAFEHTMLIVDLVAEFTPDIVARFAGLVHDLGKGVTPKEELPHHYGHEIVGRQVLEDWDKRMTMPKDWMKAGNFVIATHMKAARLSKPGKIVDLLLEIAKHPLSFEAYNAVILADSKALPYYLADYQSYMDKIKKADMSKCPSTLKGAKIGNWVREERIRQFLAIEDK